ncbi:MAG: alpha/beta hydrolase [Candidatus Bathyarchaeota archaeon]|nr:alpha/beta hydrolase [Candidatus Bathyarchaeota archaeon]
MVPVKSQTAVLPDGRQLGYTTVGKGDPVLYFHGTASSRLEVLLLKDLAESQNLQLIGVDRPGYGLSSYESGRDLQGFNGDVNALMDHLGIGRFGLLGWSGGGVFALAYLAFFSSRVTHAVVASSPSLPFDVSSAHNMPLARYIMKLPFVGVLAMRQMRREVLRAGNAAAFLSSPQGKRMLRGCSTDDLRFFGDPAWMDLMYQSMAEAFRQGEAGVQAVVLEHQFFAKPWSFSFDGVPAGKLTVWHGSDDLTCRVENAYALCRCVGGSGLEVFVGRGHCVLFGECGRLGGLLRGV